MEKLLLEGLLFAIGLVLLYYGAEWLVRGGAAIALRHGIRPLVVGLTIVAMGTSLPEFVVNFLAAFQNTPELALGNIIGSNIANIGLILGAAALVAPFQIDARTLRKEYPMMMAAMVVFSIMGMDGVIGLWDGMILSGGFFALLAFLVRDAQRNPYETNIEDIPEVRKEDMQASGRKRALLISGGIIALTGGARLMVTSAVSIAELFGVNPILIGLTIVAIGTSLPELATSVVGALRNEGDLSLGNVLGSNLFNVLFVIGGVALIKPLPVSTEAIYLHFPVMLAFGILLFPLAEFGKKLGRFEGAILLLAFFIYMGYLIYLATS